MIKIKYFLIIIFFCKLNSVELQVNNKKYIANIVRKKYYSAGLSRFGSPYLKFYILIDEKIFKIIENSCQPVLDITIEKFFKTFDGFCISGFIKEYFLGAMGRCIFTDKIYVIKFDNNFRKIYLNDDVLKGLNPENHRVNKIEILQVNLKNFVSKEFENKKYNMPNDLIGIIGDYAIENGGIRIYTDQNVFEYKV